MKYFIKPNQLILDDWSLQPFSNHLLEALNKIITEKYEQGSIIVTSKRSIEKCNELFSEPLICSALLDRLLHNAQKIIIQGKSHRMIHIVQDLFIILIVHIYG